MVLFKYTHNIYHLTGHVTFFSHVNTLLSSKFSNNGVRTSKHLRWYSFKKINLINFKTISYNY